MTTIHDFRQVDASPANLIDTLKAVHARLIEQANQPLRPLEQVHIMSREMLDRYHAAVGSGDYATASYLYYISFAGYTYADDHTNE